MPDGPIFMVGTMRSGSTLFRLILDAHPRISISEETGFMGALAAAKQIPNWTRGRDWYQRLGFSEQEFDARLREFYAGMFERHARSQGKQRWGEKTPFHSRHIPQMAEVFPDAVFVGIVRHPGRGRALARREVPLRRGRRRRLLAQHQHGDPAPRAGLADDRFALLRYEDLVEHPKETLSELVALPRRALVGRPAAPQRRAGRPGHSSDLGGQHPDAGPDQHRPRPPLGRLPGRRGARAARVVRRRRSPGSSATTPSRPAHRGRRPWSHRPRRAPSPAHPRRAGRAAGGPGRGVSGRRRRRP